MSDRTIKGYDFVDHKTFIFRMRKIQGSFSNFIKSKCKWRDNTSPAFWNYWFFSQGPRVSEVLKTRGAREIWGKSKTQKSHEATSTTELAPFLHKECKAVNGVVGK